MNMIWVEEHNCSVPAEVETICGHIAEFDHGSGYGYRCTTCNAVIGSVSMPKYCRDLMEQEKMANILKSGKNIGM